MLQILPQHLSLRNSNGPARITQTASAVLPGPWSHPAPGENTQYIWLLQLELWKSTQQKTRRWLTLWAHLRGMCYCHMHVPLPRLGGDIGLLSVALWKSVTLLAAGVEGGGWCFIWVIALAEGLLFSQLCTAMDMPADCLWIMSRCWLLSCTARRSRGWALPLNFPSFPGIIFYFLFRKILLMSLWGKKKRMAVSIQH